MARSAEFFIVAKEGERVLNVGRRKFVWHESIFQQRTDEAQERSGLKRKDGERRLEEWAGGGMSLTFRLLFA